MTYVEGKETDTAGRKGKGTKVKEGFAIEDGGKDKVKRLAMGIKLRSPWRMLMGRSRTLAGGRGKGTKVKVGFVIEDGARTR